jgi:Cu/Ag efflux protein CusF
MPTTRLFLLCATLALAASSASAQQVRGLVEKVDELNGLITVQRTLEGTVGASSAAVSNKFAVQDGLLFNALREGDKASTQLRSSKRNNVVGLILQRLYLDRR